MNRNQFALVIAMFSSAAFASPIMVSSYSMLNGGIGTYNYQDTTYSNCPASSCTTIGAQLSGGTGKLTDGVVPALQWLAGNPEGWVGWDRNETGGLNPAITFNFNGVQTVNTITFWFDAVFPEVGPNVGAPGSVSINGVNYANISQTGTGIQSFTVTGLNLTGSSINVQFFQDAINPWIMIGEVGFDTATAAPEPASWMLLSGGVLLAAGIHRIKGRKR